MTSEPTSPGEPTTPVIVGVGQVGQDADATVDPTTNADAVTLMGRAIVAAAADSGAPGITDHIDVVAVVAGLWNHRDPGRLVATELGLTLDSTTLTTFGGQTPVALVADLAARIAAGEIEVGIMVGGEATVTRHRLRSLGLSYPARQESGHPATTWGPELDMGDDVARERGALEPRNGYAVLDSALRASRGESLDEARDRAAKMWAGFADAAASNPHAVDASRPGAAVIREPTPENRMVSWPYTKAMCANNLVDRGAAVIICSRRVADRLAVPTDRRIHPHLCVTADDSPSLLERDDLAAPPGLRAAAQTLLREIGGPTAIDHVDLYGCFPSIVAITAEMLELDPEGRLSQTGGLGFAGAALNNAAGESLVAMVEVLRGDPDSLGLVQGNGGHAAKHALGVYSTEPPSHGHRLINCGFHAGSHSMAPADAVGEVWIDGVTVSYDREGPVQAIVACRFADGSRTWANSDDPHVMTAFMTDEWVGRRADVDGPTITL